MNIHYLDVPEHVLADRARRAAYISKTIIESVAGDPKPGQSALDQKLHAEILKKFPT